MQIHWPDSAQSFDALAADFILDLLMRTPAARIALPTGRTPLGVYALLRARAAAQPMLFAQARWFDLDEYVGFNAAHPASYARFLRGHLLDDIGVAEEQVRLLRGDAPDLQAECRDYDRAIAAAGGLDLAILGLGANGHIAFNEPGVSWHLRTHVTQLSDQTRAVNEELLGAGVRMPRHGLTMGIATLRQARHLLLLVSGAAKRNALKALMRGAADPGWAVTSLIGHAGLTVIASGQLRSAAP